LAAGFVLGLVGLVQSQSAKPSPDSPGSSESEVVTAVVVVIGVEPLVKRTISLENLI
jgi:hypothetical protein